MSLGTNNTTRKVRLDSGNFTVNGSAGNLVLTLTGATSLTLPTSGTLTTTANKLSVFAATTSAELAGVISDETGTGALVFANTPTFISPILGTPTSGNLVNATGYTVANLAGLGAGIATFLATPSSDNLKAAVTDETGSGALVFATSPTLVTPALGAATATSINGNTITAGTGTLTLGTFTASFGGNITTAGTFITSGANALTLTTTGATNVTMPTSGTLATQTYVDNLVAGSINYHAPANVATTAVLSGTMIANNGTPTTGQRVYKTATDTIEWFAGQGPTTIDTVTLTNGMYILVKNETDISGPSGGEGRMYNGIYEKTSADVWTRRADFNGNPSSEISNGDTLTILGGASYANTTWVMNNTAYTTFLTSPITFVQIASGLTYVGTADRITVSGATINIANTYVGQTSITTLGTVTTGTWNGTAIANAYLANSTVTVNGTSIALGASGTVTAAAGTLTGTTLNSTVVSSSLTSVGTLTGGATGAGFTIALGTSTISGALLAVNGGTGRSSYVVGDILYASSATALSALGIGLAGQVLGISGGVPAWVDQADSTKAITSISTIGASYTATGIEEVIVITAIAGGGSADDTITLPDPTGNPGRVFIIKDDSGSVSATNTFVIAEVTGTALFDGVGILTATAPYFMITLISNGTNYNIIG